MTTVLNNETQVDDSNVAEGAASDLSLNRYFEIRIDFGRSHCSDIRPEAAQEFSLVAEAMEADSF